MPTNTKTVLMTKKALAHDVVSIRAARGGGKDSSSSKPPMIVTIPKPIAQILKLEFRDRIHVYTDGETLYMRKLEKPDI